MKFRVCRQDDNGHVFTVPHEGVWYADVREAFAVKRALEQKPHKQDESGHGHKGKGAYHVSPA
jgi:hypothetical protein